MKKSLASPRFQRLAKEGSWIMVGQIATVVGSLVLVRVLTQYLEPAQYGQLALGLTAAGLVTQVVMAGISNSIGRFYSIASEANDLPGYLRASRRLMGYATAAVVAIALLLISGLWWLGYSQWIGLAAAALVFSLMNNYNLSLSSLQSAAQHRVVVACHGGLEVWLKILLAVGVMIWLGHSSTAVVIGYALSSLLVTGSQFFFLRHLIRPISNPAQRHENWPRQMWLYALPFSTFGVFTWAQQISDRWALRSFASIEDVGMYAVLFQLGYASIGLVTNLATPIVGPILYQRSGSASDTDRNIGVHRLAWRITGASLAITVIAVGFTFVLHDWIFGLLADAKYAQVSFLLPWVVMAAGLFASGQMLTLKLMSEMKPAQMTPAKILTAILGIGLNAYGASRFGVSGVVAALVSFSAIYFLWMAWLSTHLPAPQTSKI